MTEGISGARGFGWAFIDLAALGRNNWWNYAATLLRVILLPVVFIALSFAVIYAAAARHLLTQPQEMALVLMTAFASVIVAGLALVWGAERSHRRPWLSLVSTDLRFDWRRFAIGAVVEGALLGLLVCLLHWISGQPWPEGPSMGWPALVAFLLLVPFQAGCEEMLFRGYLTQALGRLVRSRVAIALVVGTVFGALHFNAYGWWTLPYLLVLSLTYSLVSLRDEGLELTMGAHAATNWFAVGAADALQTAHGAVQLNGLALIGLVANGAVFYAVTRLLVGMLGGRRREAR